MYIKLALTEWLRDRGRAIITDYELAQIIVTFYQDRIYNSEPISIRKKYPEDRDIRRLIRELISDNILIHDMDVSDIARRVLITPDESADAICCTIDPFIYISHLSAMQRHGLTDRNPVEMSFSRPNQSHWRKASLEKADQDFGELAVDLTLTPQPRPAFPERVRKKTIRVHDTRYPGKWIQARNSPVRVSDIGQTFLDMLSHSQWCGGMSHVLSVWENHAEIFLEEIIGAVDLTETKLVKVRAGYILDEFLNLKDKKVEAWTAFAQRGSSQKLDPTVEYKPVFSEKWMISLNVTAEQHN